MSTAIEVLETTVETAGDRIIVAAVRWQRAIILEHKAEAAWYQSTKQQVEDTDQQTNRLYQEYQMAKAVTEGVLAELALAARSYEKIAEIKQD